MNSFKSFHPVVVFCSFFFIIFIMIFSLNPVDLLIGYLGALLFSFTLFEKNVVFKSILFHFLIFTVITITNPIFSHNGATVLFFINDNRVTLEALIYGATLGLTVIGVIFWFKCFNKIFDSERIIYLFGKLFPSLGLVISMTLNFIPGLLRHFKEINGTLKINDTNRFRLKRYLKSFSAVITDSMEGAIITSDSMKARGYGLKGRTFYHRFKIEIRDMIYLLILFAAFIISLLFKTEFEFYPNFFPRSIAVTGIISYAFLAFMPFIIEFKEGVKWKYSISKI